MKQGIGMQVTQEPLSIHFQHRLESKRIFQKFLIFLIIWDVHSTSHQTH